MLSMPFSIKVSITRAIVVSSLWWVISFFLPVSELGFTNKKNRCGPPFLPQIKKPGARNEITERMMHYRGWLEKNHPDYASKIERLTTILHPGVSMKTIFALLLVSISFTGSVHSKTWYVEKDGSGDFVYPQAAAESAASGDTIRIGAGRFDKFVVDTPGGLLVAIMAPQQEDITIIGSGTDQTFFGPENYIGQPEVESLVGLDSYEPWNSSMSVSNIKFENMGIGILGDRGLSMTVDRCSFFGCLTSIYAVKTTNLIENCNNVGAWDRSTYFVSSFAGYDLSSFVMRNCHSDGSNGFVNDVGVGMGASEEFLIENCSFTGHATSIGLVPLGAPELVIRNCNISDSIRGILMSYTTIGHSLAHIGDCQFSNVDIGIKDTSQGNHAFEVVNSLFENIALTTVLYRHSISGFIHNSALEKGEWGVIVPYPLPNQSEDQTSAKGNTLFPTQVQEKIPSKRLDALVFDMRFNWWGTTDPDSIQAWIWDSNDNPEYLVNVLWSPPLREIVENQKTSSGGLKSMFR